ncbi:MAG: type III pantothenate kinase [Bacteroidota bacterium]
MNLVIDIGNTRSKLAVFENDRLINVDVYDEIDIDKVKKFLSNVKSVILSSVAKDPVNFADILPGSINFIELKPGTPLPIGNLYKTPETLGYDRIAAVAGANHQFRGKNVLVIDAGTCITYDFINSKNQYLGGSISPGINMRFKALNNFTTNLPLLDIDKPLRDSRVVGENTTDSILSGVLNGALAEVKGIIASYKKDFPGLRIIMTGGDLDFLEKELDALIHSKKK